MLKAFDTMNSLDSDDVPPPPPKAFDTMNSLDSDDVPPPPPE